MDFNYSTETIIPDNTGTIDIGGTGALTVPRGTTAQRPTGQPGMLRFNNDTTIIEGWLGTSWVALGNNNTFSMWEWGYNGYGQLGLGDTADRTTPTQMGQHTNWAQVSTGLFTNLFVGSDGTLWGCGYNTKGQIGDGTTADKSSPVQIGALTNWTQATIGDGYDSNAAAIKSDGSLWTWGSNTDGQLGQGNLTNLSSPTQVGAMFNWAQVESGTRFWVAIKTNGTLWSCGYNGNGQLGVGDTISRSSPTQIGTLTTWKQISCHGNIAMAVKTDGTLWGWGLNNNGQLGTSVGTSYSSPIQIGSLTNWKQAQVSLTAFVAVKTDGTLWTCGLNDSGQLGDGTSIAKSSPIQVGSLTNWAQAAMGAFHAAAVKTDGSIWTWGNNLSGQLGNSTFLDQSSPIQVGSLTNWASISCGYITTVALQGYPPSPTRGGTGLSVVGAPNQVLTVTAAGTALEYKTLVAGSGVTITPAAGSLTVSATGATGGTGNPVFFENDIAVTQTYTITAGKNAMSAGPITVNNGVVVTIPSGSVWTIV